MGRLFRLLLKRFRGPALPVLLLTAAFMITGCDSNGIFLDSPVAGLTYSKVVKGKAVTAQTTDEGIFKYRRGEEMTFSIGSLILGSTEGKPVLTPRDLVPGASGYDDQRVVNICVLLQTLDRDGDLNNGISITPEAAAIVSEFAVNFNQTPAAFAADTNVTAMLAALNAAHVFTSSEASGNRTLRSAEEALAHMKASVGERKLVHTATGALLGYAMEDDVWAWKGIPYAQAPVGDLRWKAPLDAVSWKGIREATYPCSACAQQVTDKFWRPSPAFMGSEDCLYLDVYSPKTHRRNLPVYVWIHGGANILGSAKFYDGAALAKRGNMVVVVIQYRLAMMGWLAHPALRADGTLLDQSGNYATLDHMKALQWVQKNIRAFGGDPDKVTIGGQSAGGHNVMNLVISPQNVNFRSAFAESPALSALMPLRTVAAGDAQTNALIDYLLVKDGLAADAAGAATYRATMSHAEIAAYLRGKTVAQILQSARDGVGQGSMPAPTAFMDGTVLPATSWAEAIAAGNYKKVPLIIGTTQYEFKDLMTLYAMQMKYGLGIPSGYYTWNNLYDVLNGTMTLDQVLPADADKLAYEKAGLLKSRKWQAECNAIARAMKTIDPENAVYSYLFTWAGGGDPALANFKFIFGGSHGQDIPFFFGDQTDLFKGYSFTDANSAGRVALQNAMMDYLIAFVKNGNPNPAGSALPAWTQWSNADGADKYITFDADLNQSLIGMSNAEATQTAVNTEIGMVLYANPALAYLFYALGILP